MWVVWGDEGGYLQTHVGGAGRGTDILLGGSSLEVNVGEAGQSHRIKPKKRGRVRVMGV